MADDKRLVKGIDVDDLIDEIDGEDNSDEFFRVELNTDDVKKLLINKDED